MCDVLCKEFKGWCRSFTNTEKILVIVEAILLVLFIALLCFVVIHLLVCPHKGGVKSYDEIQHFVQTDPVTIGPEDKCTWSPSHRTTAVTRYFEPDEEDEVEGRPGASRLAGADRLKLSEAEGEETDSLEEESDAMYRSTALALVKERAPGDLTFGCFLTAVSAWWAVTAASCVEAIEEVDSLDSFVILEGYGSKAGGAGGEGRRGRALADVQVHPMYQGANRSFDIVAVKAEERLLEDSQSPVKFATVLDYNLITIGERFIILGFGKFRSSNKNAEFRSLRQVYVHTLASTYCEPVEPEGQDGEEGPGGWAPRHLWEGGAVSRGRGRPQRAPLCAGVREGRAAPCQYCAGAPLLRGVVLYGVMADNQQCGVTCQPAVYVNIAYARPWLEAVTAE